MLLSNNNVQICNVLCVRDVAVVWRYGCICHTVTLLIFNVEVLIYSRFSLVYAAMHCIVYALWMCTVACAILADIACRWITALCCVSASFLANIYFICCQDWQRIMWHFLCRQKIHFSWWNPLVVTSQIGYNFVVLLNIHRVFCPQSRMQFCSDICILSYQPWHLVCVNTWKILRVCICSGNAYQHDVL